VRERNRGGEGGNGLGFPRGATGRRGGFVSAKLTVDRRIPSAEMDGSPRPGDNRPKSAQVGGDGGPKWRPARRLLGRRPMRVRGPWSWTVFILGRKQGCEHCPLVFCSINFRSIFV
jgi:hypothetical protein